MSRIAPKPVISQVARTWDVAPGMTYAVVEDADGRLWIEESCPVGTHYWTLDQAAALPAGPRTRRAVEQAITFACERQSRYELHTLPAFKAESQRVTTRSRRTSCASDRKLAGV